MYDEAVSEAQSAAAAVDAARAGVAQAEQGVPVAESHVAQAQAALAQAQAGVRGAQTGPEEIAVSRAQSGSAQAKAELNRTTMEQAALNLQYTRITAPVSGVVSRKTVEVGQVIQPGQPLLAVVPLEDVWVTANFKETQLNHMRPGQPAAISVDAYGGREYRGHVDSIAAATGARFSVLPPENASGNYVKVVQRVPVKIVLEREQDPRHLLRPGMSVGATVFTRMIRTVTIGGEYGSGRAEIARRLAEKLGWRLLDNALIQQIASTAHVDPSLAMRYDECIDSFLHRMHKALWRGGYEGVASTTESDVFDADTMAELSRCVIESAAKEGNCVIVGRAASASSRSAPTYSTCSSMRRWPSGSSA